MGKVHLDNITKEIQGDHLNFFLGLFMVNKDPIKRLVWQLISSMISGHSSSNPASGPIPPTHSGRYEWSSHLHDNVEFSQCTLRHIPSEQQRMAGSCVFFLSQERTNIDVSSTGGYCIFNFMNTIPYVRSYHSRFQTMKMYINLDA